MQYKILVLCFLFPLLAISQDGLEMKSVSIFKDKTAFFVKSGAVNTTNSSWSLYGDTIPNALNGTFWLNSPSKDFEMVKAYQKTIKTEEQAVVSDFSSMLALNNGKMATLTFLDTFFYGKIVFMEIKKKEKPEVPNLHAPLFALKTVLGKTLVFTKAQVNTLLRVEFDDNPNFIYDYTASKKIPALQIDFKSNKSSQAIDMMYLSKNLAWKPDYKIELLKDTIARLSLRSTVINEAEDIKTDKLNLVAGVPNFKYATKLSDLLTFIGPSVTASNTLNSINTFDNFSNVAVPRNEYVYTTSAADGIGNSPSTLGDFNNLDGATSMEDLYFYTLKDVELKKGERAFFDIFSVKVPIEHIYETILAGNSVSYTLEYNFIEKNNPVIHTIKLKNNSKFTWTAAPALVIKNDKNQNAPISQDKLGYTSQKDDISVKLTEAPDVSVNFLEKETGREVSKKSFKRGKYTYYNDLVSVETEITIQNFKNKDIKLDIKRAIQGELKKSNEKWQLAPRVQFGYTLNKVTDVCWELKLKAGEEKVIKYSYSFYTSEHR